jgi:hypothetical protein
MPNFAGIFSLLSGKSDLALLPEHAHGVARCLHGVVELSLAMGRRDNAARAAAKSTPPVIIANRNLSTILTKITSFTIRLHDSM